MHERGCLMYSSTMLARLLLLLAHLCAASAMAPAWGRQADPEYGSSPHAAAMRHHHSRDGRSQGEEGYQRQFHMRGAPDAAGHEERAPHQYAAPKHFHSLGSRVELMASDYARRVLGGA